MCIHCESAWSFQMREKVTTRYWGTGGNNVKPSFWSGCLRPSLLSAAIVRFPPAALTFTSLNSLNLINVTCYNSSIMLIHFSLMPGALCITVSVSPKTITSSHIEPLYKRIASQTSCSSARIDCLLRSPLQNCPKGNSYQQGWICKGSAYFKNIVAFS